MPAAAVIRRVQALSEFIGRKEFVGVSLHLVSNTGAQLREGARDGGNWRVQGLLELAV